MVQVISFTSPLSDTSKHWVTSVSFGNVVNQFHNQYSLAHTSSTKQTLNHLPKGKILDKSKLKEYADDNFKFYENGRKLSKRVENTVGKGEIAHYKQFLLFPWCFQKACFPGAS